MTTRTSITSGLWSVTGTWGTTIPADNDVVVIQTGTVVEFNADMSDVGTWPNGIDGLTINASGTLKLTRTTGTYYLKIKAAKTITGAGIFDCGASALDPIPFAAKHTITGGAAWYINGASGLTMTVYAAEPAIKTVLLTGTEIIGSTVLDIDTNVTGDIWAAGDTIHIDDINQAQESEERTIAPAGISASAITVTVGLTAAKSAGAVITLISRNVKFIGVGATGVVCSNFASGKLTVAGGQWTTANYRTFSACIDMTVSGGSFYGNGAGTDRVFYICTGAKIYDGVFTGCGYVLHTSNAAFIHDGSFTGNGSITYTEKGVTIYDGTFKGNNYICYTSTGISIQGGTFSGNSYILYTCPGGKISGGLFDNNTTGLFASDAVIKNATFSNETNHIQNSIVTCFNTLFSTGTENTEYNILSVDTYSESLDHNQTAAAFKAWTCGGVTSSQAITKPTGYTQANQTVLENAAKEGFWQKEVLVAAGASVNITMNLRKDASMAYLPRCIVFNKAAADPFAGGAGIHTFTMTDSIDTWEAETYTYSNNTANDITIVIRFQGKNASGNVFSALTVDVINVDLTTVLAILNDLHDTDLPAISTKVDTVDGVVDAIKLKTDNLPGDPADESLIEAAIAAIPTAPTVDNILDEPVEGAYTLRQAMRIMLASLAGKATGGGTATIVFRDINDSADRITATVDINGNRSAVVIVP